MLCKFHHQECTFLQNPQSRKRKTPQDLDESEVSKRRFAQYPSSRASTASTDKLFSHSSSSVKSKKSPGAQMRVIRTNNGTGVEEYDDLEEPSLLKKTLGLQNTHHSQYVGATRGLEPDLLGQHSGTEHNEVQLIHGSLRRVSSTEAFLLLPDPDTQGYSDELDDLDAIEGIIKPHGKLLVDLYFRIVHPSYPILHKEVYLEKYSRSYREFSPPLLAAVYLLALQYWSYDDKLSLSDKPDVQELDKLARKALGDTIHRPKLSTVQAGLLLLQYTDTDSAELTAQLVSVAYGLGLHLDATNWNIPDWEKGLRKRLGWGLYLQDKWSSLGSGRPSLISSANWALKPVTKSDFPENASHEDDQEGSSEVEKGRILFSHMISLSEVLADLLETVFTVQTTRLIADAGYSGLAIVLEKVKPVQLRLKEWFSNLPECLSMNSTQVMKLSSVGYLRLAYVATEITLHRRIILALCPSTDPQMLGICRSVAQERFMFAIDFVQSLKPQHLSSFWYFASAQNFALIGVFGTLLLSTASNSQEAEFYKTKLREYRWTMKISSENGARYMKPAMSMLDANMALLTKAKSAAAMSLAANKPPGQAIAEAGRVSGAADDEFSFPVGNLLADTDFTSPSQYSFHTPFYPNQHSSDGSPAAFPSLLDAQNQDFGFDLGSDSNMWSY